MLRRLTLGLLLAVLPVTFAQAAPPDRPYPLAPGAAPVALAPSADQEPQYESYRSRLLVADLLSLGAIMLGASSRDMAPVGTAGAFGLFLAAPIAHFSEGRVGAGLTSAGLRLTLPLVGAMAGVMIGDATRGHDGDQNCDCMASLGDAVLGGMVGYLGAVAIDYIWLAEKPLERPAHNFALLPTFSVTGAGTSVGLLGRF